MGDFLAFRVMITPLVIQVLFWVGVIACVIAGIAGIAQGGQQAFGGLLFLILGPIGVRVYCEILIVFFKILDTLVEIRDNASSR